MARTAPMLRNAAMFAILEAGRTLQALHALHVLRAPCSCYRCCCGRPRRSRPRPRRRPLYGPPRQTPPQGACPPRHDLQRQESRSNHLFCVLLSKKVARGLSLHPPSQSDTRKYNIQKVSFISPPRVVFWFVYVYILVYIFASIFFFITGESILSISEQSLETGVTQQ